MQPIIQIEPWIDNDELDQLKRVIQSTYVTEGNLTKEFEDKTSAYTKSKHAISICNGTCALFCALKAIGIGKNDEVLVPNLTFIATATSVLLAGAKVKLVDVDPETCCIDPMALIKAITPNTKAVIPVHLYGISCEMKEVLEICKKNNIHIIEDAAQGIGVKYNKKHVGTFGEIGVLSYYGNKTITTGEGGVVLTQGDTLAKHIYSLKNHGRLEKGTFIHNNLGWNFSFTEMQAAIGISQMNKLDKIIERKLMIYERYLKGIKNPFLRIRTIPPSTTKAVHWFTNIHCDDASRLKSFLIKFNIPTRRLFYPLNLQPCLINEKHVTNNQSSFPGSMKAYENILSLPSSVLLQNEQIDYIIDSINKYK